MSGKETFEEFQKYLYQSQIDFDQLAKWYYDLKYKEKTIMDWDLIVTDMTKESNQNKINKYNKLQKLSETHEEYIQLLTDEINELVSYVTYHDWKSSRFEQGKKLREKIKELKKEL